MYGILDSSNKCNSFRSCIKKDRDAFWGLGPKRHPDRRRKIFILSLGCNTQIIDGTFNVRTKVRNSDL